MSTPSQTTVIAPPSKPVYEENSVGLFAEPDYKVVLSNWFTAKPYGFKFTDRNNKPTTMFLPISPSNLTITTSFATNIIPTLYGTVEEHSPVRYYDITIEGTTGIAPKYIDPVERGLPIARSGRSTFSVQQTIKVNDLGGFFSKTINNVNNSLNGVDKVIKSLSKSPEVPSGLYVDQNGYVAFHNLYRFLLQYKKDAAGVGAAGKVERPTGNHPLVFFNYKDGNEYKVALRSFTLRRDKEDPMLYFYSISMRGYDLTSVNSTDESLKIVDQEQLLADLGLNGVDGSTYLGKAKQLAVNAKGVLSSVAKGIDQLGR